jgi:uncharacterized protein involved in high-affinity Fe2+ transport
MRCGLAFVSVLAFALPASFPSWAAVIGGPLLREGLEVVPSYRTGVTLDRMPTPADSIHLEADVHATRGEAHGFKEGAWIPYLSIAWSLTRDDNPTFKKSGLLYPMVSQDGPHYGGAAEMAGPGTYRLTYIISPPTSHGLLRHTGKDGVPGWWKPITASWTFKYPSENP